MRALLLAGLALVVPLNTMAKGPAVGAECTLTKSLKTASEPNGARKQTAKAGSVVIILEQAGTWSLISGAGTNGYVPASELQKFCRAGAGEPKAPAAKGKAKPKGPAIIVGESCAISDVLKVSGTAKGKGVKSDLPVNTQITVKEVSKGWVRVESAAGKGWATDKELEARCPSFGGPETAAKRPTETKPQPQGVGVDDAKPVPASAFAGALKPEPEPELPPLAPISSSSAARPAPAPGATATPASSPELAPATTSPDQAPMVPLFGTAEGSGNELFRNAGASDTAEVKARRLRRLAWVGMVGGSVGVVAGVVIYGLAARRASDLTLEIETYAAQPVRNADRGNDLKSQRAGIGHLDSYAVLAFGFGAAALGTGLALYFLGDDPSRFAKGSYRLSGDGAGLPSIGGLRLAVAPSGVSVSGEF